MILRGSFRAQPTSLNSPNTTNDVEPPYQTATLLTNQTIFSNRRFTLMPVKFFHVYSYRVSPLYWLQPLNDDPSTRSNRNLRPDHSSGTANLPIRKSRFVTANEQSTRNSWWVQSGEGVEFRMMPFDAFEWIWWWYLIFGYVNVLIIVYFMM